jgi:threonine dehydrogenase-like Zn-dependent dehydrogenase
MAEAVRVPWADAGPRKVPAGLEDERVLFCTDVIPTAWTANLWGDTGPGKSVAVFGCGPVGLLAQRIARLRGADPVFGLDVVDYRLAAAEGLCGSKPVRAGTDDTVEELRAATGGRGPDVVIEAVGLEAEAGPLHRVVETLRGQGGNLNALKECVSAVRRGGTLVVMGVYATTYDNFPWGQMFDKGLTIRCGQAIAVSVADDVLAAVASGKLRADDIVTHRVRLDDVPKAFETFNAREDGCIKVVIQP